MSREIKFRAWDKLKNKMIYNIENEFEEKITLGVDCFGYYLDEESGFEVMQYTGLKDKNGKEIYEGDIVKTHEGHLMTVIWQDNGFKLMFKFKRTYQGESYTETKKDISLNGSNDKRWGCEVIGNIYKKPELLKECDHNE